MSLASDYAARQSTVEAQKVTANESAPAKLEGPNATLSVDVNGDLMIVPKTTASQLTIPAAQALAVAQWITATFG